MNKTAIKNFAVWARRKLIADITYKAGLIGVSENGIAEPLSQSTKDMQFFDIGTKNYAEVSGNEIAQRNALVAAIKAKERDADYKTAFQNVVEEVAYTWFNRLIAVRFMEVNDYLPSRVRVLSSENSAKLEPDFVTTPFDTDLVFTPYEQDRVLQLKDENKLNELFRMLFIKQCNKLNEVLPELFEKTADYSELLLTISFTDKDGVVYHLTHISDTPEDDFNVSKEGQIEIIGWMYQYYNEERKNEVINIYKGTVKKDDIPAATQLFTTDWVVRYMVDNSLGRYWIERNPNSTLADKLDFFVTPKNGEIRYIDEKVTPEELSFFDPCMGSGHILVYAFDVLMEIYREVGYTDSDATQSIIENNLYGLDIDDRAYQLAYFAVMMKARSYDRRFLTRKIEPNVTAVQESNGLARISSVDVQVKIGDIVKLNTNRLLDVFENAKELGSLVTVKNIDFESIKQFMIELEKTGADNLFDFNWYQSVFSKMNYFIKQGEILSKKYAVVCTNPPYMNKLESHLKDFVVTNYKAYSGDLFSVFMYRNFGFCKQNGYSAFMTPFVWMFIKTYEALRNYIIDSKAITTLVQMEYSAFEEATVPICSFVLKNGKPIEPAHCFRLSDFKGGMEVQKQKVLEAQTNKECGYFYEASAENFKKIPGSPIAYWVSEKMLRAFENKTLYKYSISPSQNITGNNNKYVRKHWELKSTQIGGKDDWVFYAKGGGYRKWWGNLEDVIDWTPQTRQVYQYGDGSHASQIINKDYWYIKGITWGLITSNLPSFRVMPAGATFDKGGSTIIVNEDVYNFVLGLLNSKLYFNIASILNPTLNFQVKDIRSLPLILNKVQSINEIVSQNISLSKADWDSFETSWDFVKHPLLNSNSIQSAFETWETECNDRFNTLKSNEEELNRIFIDIYGLQDELTPEVAEKDVTVRKADLRRDIKSLISYAVGCMFGRYSLDVDGLVYAGGEFDTKYCRWVSFFKDKATENIDENGKLIDGGWAGNTLWEYDGIRKNNKWVLASFKPDTDNIIPITDEDYFHDDIVGRFVEFIKTAYGAETLEENLDFIAKALGNKGNTSREIIRNYFLNDFIKDHIKTYQKRPIYWMFDSGKQNGFKALIYMHRYDEDTTGKVRVDYLHKVQKVYESEIDRMQEIIENSNNGRDVADAEKRKEKLTKQLKEAKDYDAKIAHLALSRIAIDLDDGVKVNYEKVQTGQDGKKIEILAKI